jgi:glycerol-3-phosphate acyltransferase PlsX
VGSVFILKPITGVIRPCIPTLVPKEGGGVGVLLDVGANADCKADVLTQFGLLGALLAQHVYHVPEPKVALLNIGEEEKKGDILRQSTYELMKEQRQYRFVGNVEGRDIFDPKADVMVCDGFTGNVVLKVIEGFHDLLEGHGVNDPFLHRFNYENYGGLPVLGVNGNVIIGHGISNDIAIKSMVMAAQEVVLSKLNDRIREALV